MDSGFVTGGGLTIRSSRDRFAARLKWWGVPSRQAAQRSVLTQALAAMNPAKVVRENVRKFSDLPNIGPAATKDFEILGFKHPNELKGADPLDLYNALSHLTASYQDPCVLDVFMSVTDFLDGNPPKPWWDFTGQRKQRYGDLRIKSGDLAGS